MSSIHCATYSESLLLPLAEALNRNTRSERLAPCVLDPFGGLGHKLAAICTTIRFRPFAVEIEPGYIPHAHSCVQLGDSTKLPFPEEYFDAAITSPVYPSGMADDFQAKDDSKRNTYAHRLRETYGPNYKLQPNNSGGFNPRRSPKAFAKFMDLNLAVYQEVFRVLRTGGPFVVNTKNTVKYEFTRLTLEQLLSIGFEAVSQQNYDVPGLNHGLNQENKETFETITVVRKPRA